MRNELHNDTSYKLVFGDLFESIKKNNCDIIIPHVVANSGGFRSGFASIVEKNYPLERFHSCYKNFRRTFL